MRASVTSVTASYCTADPGKTNGLPVCLQIEAPTLQGRVDKYLALFGLSAEADLVKRSKLLSMKRARAQG